MVLSWRDPPHGVEKSETIFLHDSVIKDEMQKIKILKNQQKAQQNLAGNIFQ